MNIDAQKYPILFKAYQLEQEAQNLRSTLKYKQEAHLFFAPRYTAQEIAEAEQEVAEVKLHNKNCVCDGACGPSLRARSSYHLLEKLRAHKAIAEMLGL